MTNFLHVHLEYQQSLTRVNWLTPWVTMHCCPFMYLWCSHSESEVARQFSPAKFASEAMTLCIVNSTLKRWHVLPRLFRLMGPQLISPVQEHQADTENESPAAV